MIEPPSRPPPPLPPPRFTRSAVWQYYQKFFQKMSTLTNLVGRTLYNVFFFFSYMIISHRIKKAYNFHNHAKNVISKFLLILNEIFQRLKRPFLVP